MKNKTLAICAFIAMLATLLIGEHFISPIVAYAGTTWRHQFPYEFPIRGFKMAPLINHHNAHRR